MALAFTPSNLQWIGAAVETTPGTAAAAPTVWIPAVSPKLTPKIQSMPDLGLRGSMAKTYGNLLGVRSDNLAYSTYLYADSAMLHFLAALGTPDTVTGAADPYTHKTALLNTGSGQPASHTLFHADGTGKVYTLAGCQIDQLKVAVKPDGLVQLDASWTGMPATTGTAPANTPTALPPAPGWNSTITVAGTALSKYSMADVVFKRSTQPLITVNGTQAPSAIYCGELDVTCDLTGVYQGTTDTDVTNWFTNTQPSLLLKMAAAGDATHSLSVQMSKVGYTDATFSGSGKWMEVQAKGEAIANTTDAIGGGFSPAQAILTSAQAAAFV